jgi:PAS domain S-box-containing protein
MDYTKMNKVELVGELQKLRRELEKIQEPEGSDSFEGTFGESDDAYRRLLNSLNAGIVVHARDTSILYANATACKLLGLSLNQIKGKKALDPHWKFLNEDNSDMALADYPVTQLLASKESIDNMILGAFRPKTKDVAWFHLNGYVDLNKKGDVDRAVISFVDITGRVQSEKTLKKYQRLLAEAQKLAKIGGFSFDVKTMQQTWTEETFRIMEVDVEDGAPEVPKGVNFIAPEYRPMADAAMQGAMERGEPYDQEWEVITAKGNRKWARAKGKANYENGEITSISGSFQDITEQKLVMKELAGYQVELEERVKQRTREVENKNKELDKAMRVFVARETKILELQKKIKELQGH